MTALNFPSFEFTVRQEGGMSLIFDPARKRYVALTPEEWVRQHALRFLMEERGFPSGLVSVEGSLTLYNTVKRYDIAAFDRNGRPLLVVECKAPEVVVNQQVVDQAVRYNLSIRAPYLWVTNGILHIFLEASGDGYRQIKDLPGYAEAVLKE